MTVGMAPAFACSLFVSFWSATVLEPQCFGQGIDVIYTHTHTHKQTNCSCELYQYIFQTIHAIQYGFLWYLIHFDI